MFTFQVIDKMDNVKFFETENYTEGCILVGAIENIRCIRVWDGKELIRDERR